MPIRAVIFDLGNVLIGWNPESPYRTLIPDEKQRCYFLEHVCNAEWNLKNDLGRPWPEGLAEKIAAFPEYADLIMAYRERFQDMLTGPVAEGVSLLQRMHDEGIPCYALTNWSAETFDETVPRFPFMRYFRHVAVSGRLKIGKPDPAAFHHILGIIGEPAEYCVFIDDSLPNIEAAASLGFRTIHFLNDGAAQGLLRALCSIE
jgi:2-haloacid dehalogenase